MKLKKIYITGFRSLVNFETDFNPLTVLIGENDSGKSSILDIMEIIFNDASPDHNDFHQDLDGRIVDKITVIIEFHVNNGEIKQYCIDGKLEIKKVIHRSDLEVETFYRGKLPKDERLTQDITELYADDQKELLQSIDPTISDSEISNEKKRVKVFNSLIESSPKTKSWIEAPYRWGQFLPKFERYSAMDYKAPANMVAKTLKQVYVQSITENDDLEKENPQLIKPLRDVQSMATERIRTEVKVLEDYIQKYNRRACGISYEPDFDFSRSLRTGEFTIDLGRGLHALSKTGDGTKRRMFMAVLDWDREVSIEQSKDDDKLPKIIRGYDEPDTNLHYEAQRMMFQAISDIVGAKNTNIEAILCTHSLTMIDRAPAQSIRLLNLDQKGQTNISQLQTDEDPAIEDFLLNLARELGITNSIIFYERCFILIEGDTEENALPILYKTLYGKSLFEDSIQVINVKGNGAIKEFLKLLSKNRQSLTLILLDSDTNDSTTSRLTEEILQQSGFSSEFIDQKITYIGQNEFEDAFSNEVIASCLNNTWPKSEGNWTEEDIQDIRNEGKFSKKLKSLIWEEADTETPRWSKPEFGKILAKHCSTDDIPNEIKQIFELAREIAEI
jgi:predicted ATP-dependent endonuclease of OLD family